MICANPDCSKNFEQKTHNQKYCSDDCCRINTNKKIMQKYYEKKAIRNGAVRLCKICKSKLSRYNLDNVCSKCVKSNNHKHKKNILKALNDAGLS